jgi:2-hydroxychromene-2-carboxylate isomerase
MGQVIYLNERRSERSQPAPAKPPAFFFDVSCPMSYLTAERVERKLGEVEWVPVDSAALRRAATEDQAAEPAHDQYLRRRADACARALRLPLVWPDRFPGAAPCAARAASFACEIGAGAAFALAASRLAFCGGFDLEDPETLAEAAAAAGIPLEDCLTAAGETWRDRELQTNAEALRFHGIIELPAVRVATRWFQGEAALLAAGVFAAASAAMVGEPGAVVRDPRELIDEPGALLGEASARLGDLRADRRLVPFG